MPFDEMGTFDTHYGRTCNAPSSDMFSVEYYFVSISLAETLMN